MQRITDSMLAAALARLNAATGSPEAGWSSLPTGDSGANRWRSNPGHWHLNSAYGGVQLARMHNTAGGIESFGGYGTKREVFTRIHSMLDGLRLAAGDAATRVAQAAARKADADRAALAEVTERLRQHEANTPATRAAEAATWVHPDALEQFRSGRSGYAARVLELEAEGMTTSDAQGVADAEVMAGALPAEGAL